MNKTEYLDLKGAAEYLKLSIHTMYKMVSEKRISFFKLNRKLLFSIADLDSYVHMYRVESVSSKSGRKNEQKE